MNAIILGVFLCLFATIHGYVPSSVWNKDPEQFTSDIISKFNGDKSGKLFWDKFGYSTNWSGSNQVGGNLWQQFINKFPFLSSLLGSGSSRMTVPQYGTTNYQPPQSAYRPSLYNGIPTTQYVPSNQPAQPFNNDAVPISSPDATSAGYNYNVPQNKLEFTSEIERK